MRTFDRCVKACAFCKRQVIAFGRVGPKDKGKKGKDPLLSGEGIRPYLVDRDDYQIMGSQDPVTADDKANVMEASVRGKENPRLIDLHYQG
ncbi:unnamed protein product [Prunus armeniaca]